jgi:hypothetical protein
MESAFGRPPARALRHQARRAYTHRARAKRLTVITRALAGYRTYRRTSRAYDVCGQSWTYASEVACVHWFVSRIGNGRELSPTFLAAVP